MMNRTNDEHLDAYLTGDVSLEDLPEALQAEERLLFGAMAMLREDVRAPASLKGAVMAEIARRPRSRWRAMVDWLVQPRTVRLSPAMGFGFAVAAVAVLALLPDGRLIPGSGDPAAAVSEAAPVLTRFVFVAPEASQVTLTGDWVSWDTEGIRLTQLRGSDVWTVDVPVPPGVHEYSFIVDGSEWRPDPLAGEPVDDGFGRANSVLMVAASEA